MPEVRSQKSAALSVILPTYNESANIPELLEQITAVLSGRSFEVIVVDDDSPDKTWQVAEGLRITYPMLRVLRRVGRRGLSSAVMEGFDMATGDVLLVMDADLQHDPALLLKLLSAVESGADIAVASRYMEGGNVGDWVRGRRIISKAATWLAHMLPPVKVSDPMSGFFAIKRSVYQQVRPLLRPTGFKILFEILSFLPAKSVSAEVPLVFQSRKHGESKLSLSVEAQFLWQLLRIFLYRVQAWIFWITVIAILILVVPRVWTLKYLYINPVLRQTVQYTLQRSVEEKGWLLSELSIQAIEGDRVTVHRRRFHKGHDPMECYHLYYDDTPIEPCASSI